MIPKNGGILNLPFLILELYQSFFGRDWLKYEIERAEQHQLHTEGIKL